MKRAWMIAATLALVTAACGGSADAADGVASLDGSGPIEAVDTTMTSEITQEDALLAFTACMRDHGIDIDDPTVDADGNLRITRPNAGAGAQDADPSRFPDDDFRTARQECGELLQGVALGFQQVDRTEIEDRLLQFAACMRENGVDMPDPDFTEFGPGSGAPGEGRGGPFGDIDPDDPDFQDAQAACQDILAGFGPGGPGAGPGRFGPGGGSGEGS